MGAGGSVPAAHKKIKDRLNQLALAGDEAKKILLLGAGECGKSTILKQMRVLHADSRGAFSQHEKDRYKRLVYSNTVSSIKTLIDFCESRPEIEYSNALAYKIIERIQKLDEEDYAPTPAVIQDIMVMWADDGVKKAIQRGREFHLMDSASYFLDNIERTFAPDYQVEVRDIVRTRLKSTGIVETQFSHEHFTFKMYDVGGQRGERKRWIHAFDDVTAILFIASLSEYDQKLAEDNETNRLDESLNLFESISNLPWFSQAAIILFLNKKDVFENKIRTIPIEDYHDEYVDWEYDDSTVPKKWVLAVEGDEEQAKMNYNEGVKFFRELFRDRLDGWGDERILYIFETDATHTDNIGNIWKAVRHAILSTRVFNCSLHMS